MSLLEEFKKNDGYAILELIKSNDLLTQKVTDFTTVEFFSQPKERFNEDSFSFSIEGLSFAEDGGGGEYDFLADGSIGYYLENECDRVAENMNELFELLINCPSWWNYSCKKYLEDKVALMNAISSLKKTDKEDFLDAYDEDEYPSYDALQQEIGASLNIPIYSDEELVVLLSKYYSTASRDPKYYWNDKNSDDHSEALIS